MIFKLFHPVEAQHQFTFSKFDSRKVLATSIATGAASSDG